MGVKVDLVVHCLPPATTLSVCGETWGLGFVCLTTLVPSSCFSNAIGLVSCVDGLGALVSLWLIVNLLRTSVSGPGIPNGQKVSYFCLQGLPTFRGSDLALPQVELVTYKIKYLFGFQF